MRSVDIQVQAEIVAPGLECHHDFFERTIPGPLSQSIDRAFNLPSPADLYASQRVGNRHAEVIVAMHRPDCLVRVGYAFAQGRDEVAVQLRNRIADRIRNIDSSRAFLDDSLDNSAEKIHVGAVAILG